MSRRKSPSGKTADPTAAVLRWIAGSYATYRSWRDRGREIYLACNGDGRLARARIAAEIRQAVTADAGSTGNEAEDAETPLLEAAAADAPLPSPSRLLYVDWVMVADYALLACREPFAALVQENTRRKEEFRRLWESYVRRRWVTAARKLMRRSPSASTAEILHALQRKHPQVTRANVLEAQRQERAGVPLRRPLKPARPRLFKPYSPQYFLDVTADEAPNPPPEGEK